MGQRLFSQSSIDHPQGMASAVPSDNTSMGGASA